MADIQARFDSLTPRERQVRRVIAGLLDKQIACDLGISEVTVKIHRGSDAEERAASVADLCGWQIGWDPTHNVERDNTKVWGGDLLDVVGVASHGGGRRRR